MRPLAASKRTPFNHTSEEHQDLEETTKTHRCTFSP